MDNDNATTRPPAERWSDSDNRFWLTSSQALWRTPLICLLAPGAISLFCDWALVSSWGFKWVAGFWTAIGLLPMLALIGVAVCPFLLLSARRRRSALIGLLASVTCLVSFVIGVILGAHVRHKAFIGLAERSRPVVAAIRQYEAQHGKPPETLATLVPEFFTSIPQTGMGAYPGYEYFVGEKAAKYDGNPWAIVVFTPSGGINFDKFMYFPLQNYPEKGYGGRLQRIGDWAYVHE
jgi:hypothetical protein